MKNLVVLAAFTALFLSAQSVSAQKIKCWPLVGSWASDYFEYKGMDYTNNYQFKMQFDAEGNCNFSLVKPGGEVSYNLPFSRDPKCRTIKIGDCTMTVEKFEWADELVVRYQSGDMPEGFISPWKAKMRLIEQ